MPNEKLPILNPKPPSDNFEASFSGGSGLCSVVCEFCNRTHFCDPHLSHGDYDPGEYERLCQLEKENPDAYIQENTYDGVSFTNLDGKDFVYGCPCNAGKNYERLLLRHRDSILAFYHRELKDSKKEVNKLEKGLKKLEPHEDEAITSFNVVKQVQKKS